MSESWTIVGAEGESVLGNTARPEGAPRGVAVIAHGFKGYKDYGMIPELARDLAASGLVAHRFNFSHSGMTNELDRFARPDLFERDTWTRQVIDLHAVLSAIRAGTLAGDGMPVLLIGHSRGGVSCLLAAGREPDHSALGGVAAVVTLASPAQCIGLSAEDADRLRRDGTLESPSARTGQVLHVGRAFLDDQQEDPAGHDLPAVAAAVRVPVLLVHGTDDATVPAASAHALAAAIGPEASVREVEGGDHVFNTPNPVPPGHQASSPYRTMVDAVVGFSRTHCPG